MPPRLLAPLANFELLGTFDTGDEAAVGEWTLEHAFSVKAGHWRAWLLAGDQFRDLFQGAPIPDDAFEQLVLAHVDAQLPPSTDLPPLARVAEVPIEAASFTFACASLTPVLRGMDGFYDHLDGTHGPLENGRGVHIKLGGDGRAVVWMNQAADLVFVELK